MGHYLLEMLGQAVAIFISVLFAASAWHKVYDRHRFAGYIVDYQLIAAGYASAVAALLTGGEMAVVLAIAVPATFKLGMAAASGLLLLYAVAIAINVQRGRTSISCGCGGPGQPISTVLVMRNGALSVLCAVPALNGFIHNQWAELVFSVAVGLVLGLTYWVFAHLGANQIALQQRERTL